MSSPSGVRSSRVLQLEGDDRCPASETGNGCRLGRCPGRHVGEPYVPDLARGYQVIEGAKGLVHRRYRVEVVQPVDVDVVGLQAAQRILQLLDDGLAAGAAPIRVTAIEIPEELGAEHDPVTQARTAGQVLADDYLGMAVGVHVGRVDRVAAPVKISGQDRFGLPRAAPPAQVLAEGHRPERERAETKTTAAERQVRGQRHETPLNKGDLGCFHSIRNRLSPLD